MDLLLNLDLLSLVTKVSTELQNHVGVSDRTLAEFLIAQRVESKSSDEFRKKLDGIGADFPPSLVDSLDRLVVSLHPKFKKPDGGAAMAKKSITTPGRWRRRRRSSAGCRFQTDRSRTTRQMP